MVRREAWDDPSHGWDARERRQCGVEGSPWPPPGLQAQFQPHLVRRRSGRRTKEVMRVRLLHTYIYVYTLLRAACLQKEHIVAGGGATGSIRPRGLRRANSGPIAPPLSAPQGPRVPENKPPTARNAVAPQRGGCAHRCGRGEGAV